MTSQVNEHTCTSACVYYQTGLYTQSPRSSRWRRYYQSRGSFSQYLASEVQKRSNSPVPSQKLGTKVSKSRAIPPYVPGVNPPGMTVDKCIRVSDCFTYNGSWTYVNGKRERKKLTNKWHLQSVTKR